jgi:hypothetical protein
MTETLSTAKTEFNSPSSGLTQVCCTVSNIVHFLRVSSCTNVPQHTEMGDQGKNCINSSPQGMLYNPPVRRYAPDLALHCRGADAVLPLHMHELSLPINPF